MSDWPSQDFMKGQKLLRIKPISPYSGRLPQEQT